jgi:hypothetical protein
MVVGSKKIFIKIRINNINIILGYIYIPPNAMNYTYSNFCEVVDKIYTNFSYFYFIIRGDFNFNNYDWPFDPANQGYSLGSIIFISYVHFFKFKTKKLSK